MSLSAVKRLRHRLGLRCKHLHKYKAPIDSKHTLPIARIYWIVNLRNAQPAIRSGLRISLISLRMRVGYASRL